MPGSQVFQHDVERTVLVIAPRRNISSLTEDEVRAQWGDIVAELDKPDVKHIIFDFAKVNYFGSSMLEAMLSLWKRVNAQGGKLVVCNVSDTARDILRISKFDTIWPICESLEGALDTVDPQ